MTGGDLTVRPNNSIRAIRPPRGWRAFFAANIKGLLGAFLLGGFIFMALFTGELAPHDPHASDFGSTLRPPVWIEGGSSTHLLGTDRFGRDVLSRLIHGTRVAFIVGFGAVAVAALIGITLGVVAGYFGGWYDTTIMRFVDTLLAIPNTLLYLTVVGLFGPSLGLLIAVIGLVNWTLFARVVRGEVLAAREREYIVAARAIGQRASWIILRHVIPNILGPVIVVASLNVASVILLEAALSFLGFGVQPPTVTWGRMLADGRVYVATAWWLATFPGIFITLLALALILVGDWLRDFLDPRTS